MPEATIRPATRADIPALVGIINHYILRSNATFETEPTTVEARIG